MRRRPNPASGHAVRQRSVPSVVLLLKVQLEGHAFRQFLEQFLELRAGGGGDLDGHLRHLRGRGGGPPLPLSRPGGGGGGGGGARGGGGGGGGWGGGWCCRRGGRCPPAWAQVALRGTCRRRERVASRHRRQTIRRHWLVRALARAAWNLRWRARPRAASQTRRRGGDP